MMKKRLVAILCAIPLIAYATDEAPLPKQGLQIVPLSAMSIPEDMKKDILKIAQEQKTKGYHETSDTRYQQSLFKIQKRYTMRKKYSGKSANLVVVPEDVTLSDIKDHLSDIPLAFPFNNINWVELDKIMGFVPQGSLIKDNNNPTGGWSGIKVLFSDDQLGACSYSYLNLKLSHGGVQLNTETTEYLVNKHPSTKIIEGNINDGFVYTINWDKEGEMHTLDCANMKFDKEITKKMIALANKIDSASSK